MVAPQQFTKVDLTPRRHHGYAVVLFILGTLFPPLAVAARFGIGADFWLNLLLTICGYIPGHVHNFYIQNIRNNKTHARTPKWAQRYGLIDTSEIRRKERKSQWAGRYNERLPHSALDEQPLEDGQEGGSSVDVSLEGNDSRQRNGGGELWSHQDERYYGQNADGSSVRTGGSGGGRWHYPANFDDAVAEPSRKKSKKKKDKKDRWARTEDAYSLGETEGTSKKRKSKKKKSHSALGGSDTYSRRSDSTNEFPEDAEGGLYGDTRRGQTQPSGRENEQDILNQEL